MTCFGKSNREKILHMSKASAIQLPQGVRPLGKIEVLPNAIHTIAMQATSECYGVVGLTAPRLHNGQAVLLQSEQSNQRIQVRVVNEKIIVKVYNKNLNALVALVGLKYPRLPIVQARSGKANNAIAL